MRHILIYWRDLSKQSKSDLMNKYKITVITYSDIKIIYESENNLKK